MNPNDTDSHADERSTRDKLIASGRRLFLQNGFRSTPLRRIASDAGFTSGAFYGCFPSKEALFSAITHDAANGLIEILDAICIEICTIPAAQRLGQMCSIYTRHIPEIADFLLRYPDEIRLLLTRAQGTKYENFLHMLQERNFSILRDSAPKNEQSVIRMLSPYTVELVISGYYDMLSHIMLERHDRESICRCMTELIAIYEHGFLHLRDCKAPGFSQP